MGNYKINTSFHLDLPKEACDTLKLAVKLVCDKASIDSLKFQKLGFSTRKIIRRCLENSETFGVKLVDGRNGGVIVNDSEGAFEPYMFSDLLRAVMKDHNIEGFVSFSWSENCKKHRINAFSGGGVVISAKDIHIMYVPDWIYEMTKKMQENNENISEDEFCSNMKP